MITIARQVPEGWDCGLDNTNFTGNDPAYVITIPEADHREYEDRMACIVQRFAELLPDNDVDRGGMLDRLEYILDGSQQND